MADNAHKQTDTLLTQLQKQNKKKYLNSYRELRKKLDSIYNEMNLTPAMDINSKMNEINKYGRFEKMVELVAESLTSVNSEVVNDINSVSDSIYQLNYNYMAEKLGSEENTKKESKDAVKDNINPYNTISINNLKDKNEAKKNARSTLLNILMQGLSMATVSKLYEKNLSTSNMLANSNGTRIENLSRIDAMIASEKKAEEEGYVLVKVWNSRKDSKVRDAHSRADGQEAQLDKPFYVGGERLMYPADPNGSAGNVINCRCYLTYKKVAK